MDIKEKLNPEYLGDSVYAQPWNDMGIGGVMITTNSHIRIDAEEVIYLEPKIADALKNYIIKVQNITQIVVPKV